MNEATPTQLFGRIQRAHTEGRYRDALELASEGLELFPNRAPYLNYWRMGLAARLGDDGLACDVLEDMLKAGVWYSQRVLRDSPSLQTLQGHPRFERLVATSAKHQSSAKAETLVILEPESSGPKAGSAFPLMLALHGNNSNAMSSADLWRPMVDDGWLIALPQSSEVFWTDAYVWHDPAGATKEVEMHYNRVRAKHEVDANQTIVSGFSRGGHMAIWVALTSSIKPRGFVAVAPSLDQATDLLTQAEQTKPSGLRGYIIAGERDEIAHIDEARKLVAELDALGIRCQLEGHADMSHEFPAAARQALIAGARFVLEEV